MDRVNSCSVQEQSDAMVGLLHLDIAEEMDLKLDVRGIKKYVVLAVTTKDVDVHCVQENSIISTTVVSIIHPRQHNRKNFRLYIIYSYSYFSF